MPYRESHRALIAFLAFPAALAMVAAAMGGCPGFAGWPVTPVGVYNNTTDPSNRNATYIGSAACEACHPTYASQYSLHAHRHILKRIQDGPPTYPLEATGAGVPNPPAGKTWSDISYVIGGYTKAARFVDLAGYILTNGTSSTDTQWNLSLPFNGTSATFAPYESSASQPLPYDYSCFQCHTTGSRARSQAHPESQDNRPGIAGTWNEEGVNCESCHGPGSNHVPSPAARDLFVDSSASACAQCHTTNFDPSVILAKDGFIEHHQQWSELFASGGHKNLACTYCHNTHSGTTHVSDKGIRNQCAACHTDKNMALHDGKVTLGDFAETLTCVSCHMPYATMTASKAPASIVGPLGRLGDTKTHIFRIAEGAVDFNSFFSPDGKSVRKDSEGRAAVTVDFVCLRCHNGNRAFNMTVSQAADKVKGLHQVFP